jgi:small subunit ribosomal protein S2
LLTKVVAEAAAAGLLARSGRNGAAPEGQDKPEPGVASDEPLAEWEKELLAGSEGGQRPAEQTTSS